MNNPETHATISTSNKKEANKTKKTHHGKILVVIYVEYICYLIIYYGFAVINKGRLSLEHVMVEVYKL
jgi:hypothetical protein